MQLPTITIAKEARVIVTLSDDVTDDKRIDAITSLVVTNVKNGFVTEDVVMSVFHSGLHGRVLFHELKPGFKKRTVKNVCDHVMKSTRQLAARVKYSVKEIIAEYDRVDPFKSS